MDTATNKGADTTPRNSVDLPSSNSSKNIEKLVFVPEVRKVGYLMRKSGFLKRWSRQFCVLDRFSLSMYDSEDAMRSGKHPNDVVKLHGTSVYDGGPSLTLKSTRIHISTDDGRLHCFSSKEQKQVSEWMVALYEAMEHLSTIDFGPEGQHQQQRQRGEALSFDDDFIDNVGIGMG